MVARLSAFLDRPGGEFRQEGLGLAQVSPDRRAAVFEPAFECEHRVARIPPHAIGSRVVSMFSGGVERFHDRVERLIGGFDLHRALGRCTPVDEVLELDVGAIDRGRGEERVIVHPHRDVAHLTLLFEDDQPHCGVDRNKGYRASGERQAKSPVNFHRIGVDMRVDLVDRELMTLWTFGFH